MFKSEQFNDIKIQGKTMSNYCDIDITTELTICNINIPTELTAYDGDIPTELTTINQLAETINQLIADATQLIIDTAQIIDPVQVFGSNPDKQLRALANLPVSIKLLITGAALTLTFCMKIIPRMPRMPMNV